MSAYARLRRLRRSLAIVVAARALLFGGAVALSVLAVARLTELPSWSRGLALLIGGGVATALLLRLRQLQSLSRVALWVEERTPSLRYALVTIADGTYSSALEAQALGVSWWTKSQRALVRSLIVPGLAVAAAAVVSVWPSVERPNAAGERSGLFGRSSPTSTSAIDVLATIRIAVTPPLYSGRPASTLDDPTSIDALVGSEITVTGGGDARLLVAVADSMRRNVVQRGGKWSVRLAMPTRPAILRLHSAAGRDRLIVLAPIADAAPVVALVLPAHDTILRRATGIIALHAQVRDDIGLRDAAFELVVSSGAGENFTFRTTTIAHTQLTGRSESTLDARVSLDSLQLVPGDIVQLRAVARDGNTVTGPGVGSSETRSLRVARADEYDSVSVEALPPPDAEAQVLSQRMLIILTEALVRHQPTLTHRQLVRESQGIAFDQRTLRKRVGDVVFQRLGGEPLTEEGVAVSQRGKLTPEDVLRFADSKTAAGEASVMDVEGDETPILAVSKPLLEAFNAMWDAGRALEVGEPIAALPPMRMALAAIERARRAERIYLRGRPSTTIVNITKVRLAGKDKGASSMRERRPVVDPVVRRRTETFERVTALIARNPDAAADSVLLMRVDALAAAPLLASALEDAARALRRGDDANIERAWMRVRRAIGGEPVQRAGVSAWSGVP